MFPAGVPVASVCACVCVVFVSVLWWPLSCLCALWALVLAWGLWGPSVGRFSGRVLGPGVSLGIRILSGKTHWGCLRDAPSDKTGESATR